MLSGGDFAEVSLDGFCGVSADVFRLNYSVALEDCCSKDVKGIGMRA